MQLLYGVIPTLVILSVIISSIPIESEASNHKVIVDYSQKIVFQFEDTNDLINKQNQFEEIMTEIIKDSQKDFKKAWKSLDYRTDTKESAIYIIGTNPTNGKSIYESYPDIIFSGETRNPMTDEEFNILFDAMLSKLRIDMVNYFFDEGYTNVKTHIHYSDPNRESDYDEGF